MLLIAHRGASARAPENTLMAFREALEAGADGIEFDARLTSDGHIVLMHDDDVSRTTPATGRVSEMTLEQVRALDAGRGESVPTLDEAFGLIAGRAAIVLEVKGAYGGTRVIEGAAVARALCPHIVGVPRLVVSSFDPGAVATVRALEPSVATAITCGRGSELDWALALAVEEGHTECHVPEERVDRDFTVRAHHAGKAVLAYTVNDPERARTLKAMGLRGIFSDDPAGMLVATR
jgi:glycerophosphoryl diester phosphodiesterase